MDQEVNYQWLIYSNVLEMFKYRKINLIKSITEDQAKGFMAKEEAFEAEGIYADDSRCVHRGKVIVAVLNEHNDILRKSANFTALLKNYKKYENIIVVVNSEKNPNSQNIKKALRTFQETEKSTIELYKYDAFVCNKMTNYMAPKMTIVSKEDSDNLLKLYKKEGTNLQKILSNDAQAIWIGVVPGQIVRAESVSNITKIEISYRYCIDPLIN